jgi:MscS family membrane protein
MNKDSLLQQFIDLNTPNYLLWYVLGTIVLVLLISKYLSRYIATLFFNVFKKAGKKLNKDAYYNLLVTPLRQFIVWMTVLISLEKITLPIAIKTYSLYGKVTIGSFLETLSAIILVIVLIRFVIRIIDYVATILETKANLTATQGDNQLIVFFKDFFKVILILIGFLLILKYGFSQNIGNLLTGLSIVGAAIALATKESLENLIASFIIFFDKPFVTGDEVKVQHVTGTIERIGLRSTRIRTLDKTYVTVPNKQMVDSIVDNQSLRTLRKVAVKLELDHKTTIEQLKTIKQQVNDYLQSRKDVNNFTIYFADITKLSNQIQLDYYLETTSDEIYIHIKDEVNFKIIEILKSNNINISTTTELK